MRPLRFEPPFSKLLPRAHPPPGSHIECLAEIPNPSGRIRFCVACEPVHALGSALRQLRVSLRSLAPILGHLVQPLSTTAVPVTTPITHERHQSGLTAFHHLIWRFSRGTQGQIDLPLIINRVSTSGHPSAQGSLQHEALHEPGGMTG